MKFRNLKNGLLLISILFSGHINADEISTYSISYIASTNGVKADAQRSLAKIGSNTYKLVNTLEAKIAGQLITKIDETSEIKISKNAFKPIFYKMQQSGVSPESIHINYNWEKMFATIRKSNEISHLDLKPNTFDQLSHQLKLRNSITTGKNQLAFNIINRNNISEYIYRILGKEEIITPLGKFKSTKIERVHSEKIQRKTIFWLADEWHGILLRLSQTTNFGINIILEIQEGVVNDILIKPAN